MTRRERGRRLVPFAAALTVVGVVVLSFSTSGHRPALAAPPPMPQRPLDAMSAPACPLPVGQQIKSVKAFGKMLPTFRHPRCFNCHGGLDIKSKRHPGYEHARAFPKDPRKDLLTMPERADLHANCDVCHTNIKGELTRLDGTKLTGWLVAPMPMNFVDRTGKKKSDKEMCLQMKRFEPTGTQFVDHLKTDHGEIKFIEAAFNGDRALDSANLVDHKIRIQKPPGSQASLIELAQTWVKEVGDGYTASPECGCVVPNIKLQVHHRSAIDPTHVTHRAGWVGFSGDANFEVSMAAVHEAQGRIYYTGEKSLVRSLQPYFADKRCQGTASQQEEWLWSAEVDTASERMTLRWSFTSSEEKGQAECITGGHRTRMPLEPSIFGGQSLEPLVMPLDSETVQVTGKEEQGSGQEWLKIKVIGAPRD